MQLTPEQRADIERQRRENPGARIFIQHTPEQAEERRRAYEEEEASREANIANARKMFAALEEPGFSGDLRRAIAASRKTPSDLASSVGASVTTLEAFLDGDASLPTDVVDRLVALLRLKLVMEIPS
jgi:hypothetical protein